MKVVVVMCDSCQAEVPDAWQTLSFSGCVAEGDRVASDPTQNGTAHVSGDYCSVRCMIAHLTSLLDTATTER